MTTMTKVEMLERLWKVSLVFKGQTPADLKPSEVGEILKSFRLPTTEAFNIAVSLSLEVTANPLSLIFWVEKCWEECEKAQDGAG